MKHVFPRQARELTTGEPLRELALALPAALAAPLAAGLAWREQGSILAEHWLLYAILLAALVAVVLAAGLCVRPGRALLVSLARAARPGRLDCALGRLVAAARDSPVTRRCSCSRTRSRSRSPR